jgi:tetratricopeptide (TPR) repeat protein
MLNRNPADGRAHFGLAAEFEKLGDWDQVIGHLQAYLQLAEDQGNAWGRLARAHVATGDVPAAAAAYRKGIEAARQHGHPSMAAEFEDALSELTV